jgi:hypothetical protein
VCWSTPFHILLSVLFWFSKTGIPNIVAVLYYPSTFGVVNLNNDTCFRVGCCHIPTLAAINILLNIYEHHQNATSASYYCECESFIFIIYKFKPGSEAEILQYQYSTTYFSDKNDVKVIKRLKLNYNYQY